MDTRKKTTKHAKEEETFTGARFELARPHGAAGRVGVEEEREAPEMPVKAGTTGAEFEQARPGGGRATKTSLGRSSAPRKSEGPKNTKQDDDVYTGANFERVRPAAESDEFDKRAGRKTVKPKQKIGDDADLHPAARFMLARPKPETAGHKKASKTGPGI